MDPILVQSSRHQHPVQKFTHLLKCMPLPSLPLRKTTEVPWNHQLSPNVPMESRLIQPSALLSRLRLVLLGLIQELLSLLLDWARLLHHLNQDLTLERLGTSSPGAFIRNGCLLRTTMLLPWRPFHKFHYKNIIIRWNIQIIKPTSNDKNK